MTDISTNAHGAGWRRGLAVLLLGGTTIAGFAAFQGRVLAAAPVNAPPAAAPAGTAIVPDFADLVARVKPAVVSITTHLKPDAAAQEQGIPTPFGMLRPSHPQAVEARGSGFIINANGTVVTNNHVVKGAATVSVILDDGTRLPARVIGTDPRTDLAVLKIDAGHPLPYVALGDSNAVRPGQWVVAMGNPFGLGGTVTAGIVSARGRNIGEGPYDSFIQVDAPINQGNSGGPLFTQTGQVIGINTAIISPSGGSVGIGFAIPSEMIKSVVAQLEASGHVTRGYLGVETQPVNAAIASALNLPKAQSNVRPGHDGALVASVQPDSPAAKAGLQPGDIIQAVDGKPIGTPRDLAIDIADMKPGSPAKLAVVRDGTPRHVDVVVATLPGEKVASAKPAADKARVGLALAPLSPNIRSQLSLPDGTSGAVVADVQQGSPAAQAGIQQGDVIVGVGNKTVHSVEQATSAIRSAEAGKSLALRILRNGHAAFVAIDLSGANAG
ncbi:MAG: DegQ family serine endoprotease [Rhodospirillales bacterium]|nr:DegQ family serine endoprotease [Rhodospirillales bacterium]